MGQSAKHKTPIQKLLTDSCRDRQATENGRFAICMRKNLRGYGFDTIGCGVLGATYAAEIEPVSQANQSSAKGSKKQQLPERFKLYS